MALLVGLIPLVVCVVHSTADLTLNSQHDVTGTWKRPVVLPCTFTPHNYVQLTVTWLYRRERIFVRDDEGDHTFITKYRSRLSLPQNGQRGDVSLTIRDLQTDDKGEYTCQVSWILVGATNRITKEAVIDLAVEKADLTLNSQHDVTGTWKRSVVLPCTFTLHNYVQLRVAWLYRRERIFVRDDAGDHTFITKYRSRLSLPQNGQRGDVSLTIMDLQTDDKGEYTCQVSLILVGATNRITKEAVIDLAVEKVRVTKPVIQPGGLFLVVAPQSTINLTCSAEGSPPITYRWYKQESGSSVRVFQEQGASFIVKKALPSHSGIYVCEAENKALERYAQQSEVLQLDVSADGAQKTTHSTSIPKIVIRTTELTGTIGKPQTTEDSRTTAKKTPGIHKQPTSTADIVPNRTLQTTRIPIFGSTKPPGKEGSLQTTRDSSTAAMSTATFSTGLQPSSSIPPWLILLVALLSLALVGTLIAVFVTRSKKRKGTDDTYEIPIMGELNARANQNPSAAPIYRVTTCQANGSQANAPWTNDTVVPRNENQYEPTMAEEAEPQSDYQNALFKHESEYEELLVGKGSEQQT